MLAPRPTSMIMGESSGSLIFAVPYRRTSTHNSMKEKPNANSSVHMNEHRKSSGPLMAAPQLHRTQPALHCRLIHKPRVIPHAALNEAETERRHSRWKTTHSVTSPFHFHFHRGTMPVSCGVSVSGVRRNTESCCRQLVAERQPAKGS